MDLRSNFPGITVGSVIICFQTCCGTHEAFRVSPWRQAMRRGRLAGCNSRTASFSVARFLSTVEDDYVESSGVSKDL